ncbi:hypothetical protein KY358_00140 [Candidatus Woesearchaeota archaeon]|nr:hypothetical protein [Candidatus Woesearchaeota archaeon]
MKKIKKMFRESSFLNVFRLIRKSPHIYLYTVIIDFIFLAFILIAGKFLGSLIPSDPARLMAVFKTQANLLLFVILYPVIFYLFVILIYSLAKLMILNIALSLYEKRRFKLQGFGKFYCLNLLLFIIFLTVALAFISLSSLIFKMDFLKYVALVFMLPFAFFSYSILNIAHTLFIKDRRSGMIRSSFKIAFHKTRAYSSFAFWSILLALSYLVIYNILHQLFRFTLFLNKDFLSAYGPLYVRIFNISSIIFVYLIIAFNRIYFLENIDKNVLP